MIDVNNSIQSQHFKGGSTDDLIFQRETRLMPRFQRYSAEAVERAFHRLNPCQCDHMPLKIIVKWCKIIRRLDHAVWYVALHYILGRQIRMVMMNGD